MNINSKIKKEIREKKRIGGNPLNISIPRKYHFSRHFNFIYLPNRLPKVITFK